MLDAWCSGHLGAGIADTLFTSGHLSRVTGVRLTDGRAVVVKVRPTQSRYAGCTDIQRALSNAGFPCPRPLVGPVPYDDDTCANAEAYVPGGAPLPVSAVDAYAALLARFIGMTRNVRHRPLEENPPWVAWDHPGAAVWPVADDTDADLNDHPATAWLDDAGRRVRERLRALSPALGGTVVGHGDWEGQNLRWLDGEPLAVHDWDSVVAGPESVLVGLAAAVWPCGVTDPARPATVPESSAFIREYQRASDRTWSPAETAASWAAGLWVSAFNTKKAAIAGYDWMSRDDIESRLRLAVG